MSACHSGLPCLPGFRFNDSTKEDYRKSSQFGYSNGYPVQKRTTTGIGQNTPLVVDSILYSKIPKDTGYNPSLTYGKAKERPYPPFIPPFVTLDGITLSFDGYTVQPLEQPSVHSFKVRRVKICYYVLDNTISVSEPFLPNLGYKTGMILKRGQIPNPHREHRTYHWSDLNNGVELDLYGTTYKLCSCNSFTRTYLESQGILVGPNEPILDDPYIYARRQVEQSHSGVKQSAYCDMSEVQHQNKIRRFLACDGIVLRFYAAFNSNESEDDFEPPIWKFFEMVYYLVDDLVAVYESKKSMYQVLHPLYLKKSKLPKNWKNIPSILQNQDFIKDKNIECQEFYEPKDFIIGSKISVMGRRFIIYDVDKFTRKYFKEILGIIQPDPIKVDATGKQEKKRYIPPHNIFGDPDDTLQNCISLRPQALKADFYKFMNNSSNILKYKIKMTPTCEEDNYRNFCMKFCLGDDKMIIYELAPQKSGYNKGRFMASIRLRKPGFPVEENQFYGTKDFAIGAVIHVRGSEFTIVDVDSWTYNFMINNPEYFTQEAIDGLKKHKGSVNNDNQAPEDHISEG